METITASLQGMYRDILRNARSSVVYDSGWRTNTIVLDARILLAAFMRGDPCTGIICLKVGQGDEEWDQALKPVPPNADVLTDPNAYELELSEADKTYLPNASSSGIFPNCTNGIQIVATLNKDFPSQAQTPYPLREFGLFGKIKNTLCMINCVRHPVIHKDNQTSLERIIKLYF